MNVASGIRSLSPKAYSYGPDNTSFIKDFGCAPPNDSETNTIAILAFVRSDNGVLRSQMFSRKILL